MKHERNSLLHEVAKAHGGGLSISVTIEKSIEFLDVGIEGNNKGGSSGRMSSRGEVSQGKLTILRKKMELKLRVTKQWMIFIMSTRATGGMDPSTMIVLNPMMRKIVAKNLICNHALYNE